MEKLKTLPLFIKIIAILLGIVMSTFAYVGKSTIDEVDRKLDKIEYYRDNDELIKRFDQLDGKVDRNTELLMQHMEKLEGRRAPARPSSDGLCQSPQRVGGREIF